MRTVNLTITAVHSSSPKETWVSFSTRQGEGTALWAGGLLLPEKGRVYGVEWDIEIPLEPSMVSTESAAQSSGFSTLGQNTLVRAILESLDEDGVGCLRIAGDCLIKVVVVEFQSALRAWSDLGGIEIIRFRTL